MSDDNMRNSYRSLWTPELLAKLRAAAVAGKTVAEAAEALGLGVEQIRNAVQRYNIRLAVIRGPKGSRLVHPPKTEAETAAALRQRWEKIIPGLKAKLARELRRRDMADRDETTSIEGDQ